MPQQGCWTGQFRRAELLLRTPEKRRLYWMPWSSEGQEEQVFLQSLLFTVTDTDSVWREADETIWIKPGEKAIGSATWHTGNRSNLRQAAKLLAEHKWDFFLLLVRMGSGWQMEIARFTQVHNPYAADISTVQRVYCTELCTHHLYCSPVLQTLEPFLHLCCKSRSPWKHSEKALIWVRTPSISDC